MSGLIVDRPTVNCSLPSAKYNLSLYIDGRPTGSTCSLHYCTAHVMEIEDAALYSNNNITTRSIITQLSDRPGYSYNVIARIYSHRA